MSLTGQPRLSSRARPALVLYALAAVLVLALASCGSSDQTIGGSSTAVDRTSSTRRSDTSVGTVTSIATTTTTAGTGATSTSTPSSSQSPDAAHQEIIDSYIAYWDARIAANTGVPNPQDPALARYATGRQLEGVIAETQKNLDEGKAFQPSPHPANFRRVTVVSINGDSAQVQECFVDDGQVIERATGRVLNDAVSTQSVLGNLQRIDGQWRVSGSDLVQRWEGVGGCALAT